MDKNKKSADDKALFALFAIVHSNRSAEPTPLELWDLMNTLAREGTEECAKLIAWRDSLSSTAVTIWLHTSIRSVDTRTNTNSPAASQENERRLELVRQQIDLMNPFSQSA